MGSIGIMEKNMETTIGFRVHGFEGNCMIGKTCCIMAILLLNRQVVIIRPSHRVHVAILESQNTYMETGNPARPLLLPCTCKGLLGSFFHDFNLRPPDVQRSGTCPCRKGT